VDHEALRREYTRATLDRSDLDPDPLAQLRRWFDEATAAGLYLPDAMTLATVGTDGAPDARIVVLRGIDTRGLLFFTNRDSNKGRELALDPRAALVFHWNEMERQVRVRGRVREVARAEAAAYFAKRPRESQLSAAASPQSEVIQDRASLEARVRELEELYAGGAVPPPPGWTGYRLAPAEIEFWQGRPSRLHDRFRYVRGRNAWRIERLAP